MRWAILGGCLLFLAVDGPGEMRDIGRSLVHPLPGFDAHLAMGLGVKLLMTLGTVVGLLLRQRFALACLLALSLQAILMRIGTLTTGFHVEPVVEVLFRIFCVYAAVARGKEVLQCEVSG